MLLPIQLPPGIERNNSPYDTPNAWWDMSLVRWRSGSLVPIKGNQRVTSTALNGPVRKIFVYRANDSTKVTLVGTANKLYVDNGGTFADITPASFSVFGSVAPFGGYGTFNYNEYNYGTARTSRSLIYSPFYYWTFSNWGEDVICTANSDGRLFYYDTTTLTTAPTVIATAPLGNTSVVVTDERHVMCIGQQGGTPIGSNRRVAWSSREDYTDWNFASLSNTAGYQDLTTRTPLQKGVKVKEGVLIFSLTDVYLAQYVGQPFVYGFQRISDTELFHPDSIATFNGKAVWLSRQGFQLYNGGFVQPLPCPILDDILSDLNATYGPSLIHGCHHGQFPEVWWFYPSTNSTVANRYVIWNYLENWWGWGALTRSAMSPAEVWEYPYMGDEIGNVFMHDVGYTDAGVTRVGKVFAETGALGIGNGDNTVEVRQVLPATGTGYNNLQISFYGRFTPEGNERTFGPYSPRSDGYTDVRVSAREARIRFAATQDADFGIGKMRLDVAQGGGR